MNTSKIIRLTLLLPIMVMISCTTPATDETKTNNAPPISQKTADSIISTTGEVPLRTNIRGKLNETNWVSTSFGINIFNVANKKTYAIFLTNGKQKISVNYSGPEKKGTVSTGEFLQAAILKDSPDPYICEEGFVVFTQFDTLLKTMSGTFTLKCMQKDKKANAINFNDVAFDNLNWK